MFKSIETLPHVLLTRCSSFYKVFRRQSLPDLAGDRHSNLKSVAFDSRLDYPGLEDFSRDGAAQLDREHSAAAERNEVATVAAAFGDIKSMVIPDEIAHMQGRLINVSNCIRFS